MALRYVARRFAVPSLRRASGPGCVAASGLAPLSNGDAARKQCHEEKERAEFLAKYRATIEATEKERAEFQAKYRATIEATEAALRKAEKMDKLRRRVNIASLAVSFSLAVYTVFVVDRKYGDILRQRAFDRQAKRFSRGFIGGEADRDDDDM